MIVKVKKEHCDLSAKFYKVKYKTGDNSYYWIQLKGTIYSAAFNKDFFKIVKINKIL